ncbi:cupin-like domain-containing protein, partial [Pyxidicoccus sp. 3LFB2]
MGDATSEMGPEWRAWLAENLVLGVAPETLERTLLQTGLPPERARAEVESARQHPAVTQGQRRAASH